MSSTRLISKNLSQPPLAFFTLMAIFPPSLFNEFLFNFDVKGPIHWSFTSKRHQLKSYECQNQKLKMFGLNFKDVRQNEKII